MLQMLLTLMMKRATTMKTDSYAYRSVRLDMPPAANTLLGSMRRQVRIILAWLSSRLAVCATSPPTSTSGMHVTASSLPAGTSRLRLGATRYGRGTRRPAPKRLSVFLADPGHKRCISVFKRLSVQASKRISSYVANIPYKFEPYWR